MFTKLLYLMALACGLVAVRRYVHLRRRAAADELYFGGATRRVGAWPDDTASQVEIWRGCLAKARDAKGKARA